MRIMRDRLIELVCEATQEDNCVAHCNYPPCNKCKSIADHLLSNGVIVLPFEIGDTVYDISEYLEDDPSPQIYELRNREMTIEKTKYGAYRYTYDGCYICPEKIGTQIFFTKAEAERALKGGAEE